MATRAALAVTFTLALGLSIGDSATPSRADAEYGAQKRVVYIGGSRVRILAEGRPGGARVLGLFETWSTKLSAVCRLRVRVWSQADLDDPQLVLDQHSEPFLYPHGEPLRRVLEEQIRLSPGDYIISLGLERDGDISAQGSAEVRVPE